MTRILLFVVGIIAAALAFGWLADRPGAITVEWLGYEFKTSAFVGALVLAAVVAALMLAWSLLRYLFTRPAAMAAYMHERRRRQGFDALTRGLLAIGVGDRSQAQRYASVARRNLPNEPLTALLKAQAAQLKGDRASARRTFQAMLDRPETELLGLRGLFLEAKRGNDNDAARALAEQAVRTDPQAGWSVNALFDMQARAGDWEGALATLAVARKHGNVDADMALRRRAVLLTAEARDIESSQPDKALALANEALRLAPSLIPAAEIAGRLLASKGEARQASRLVARTWKLAPHPDLATVYAFAKPGEAPRDRLKRVEHLASLTPGDIEGQIAIAVAAIEARDWQAAEAALSPYLHDRPPARLCALMARIEAGEGNKGREREWLARAVRGPRDRAWIADGYISDRWLPVSPLTGAVDAFEWKAPVDAIGRGDETLLIEESHEPPEPPAPLKVAAPVEKKIEKAEAKKPELAAPRAVPAGDGASARAATIAPATPVTPREQPGQRSRPELYVAPHAPDDPGVASADPDESPASLERLRAAQIR
jgi:HemY protein